MKPEIYPNSPITEALIDIRIDPPLGRNSIAAILSTHDQIKSKYPEKKERRTFETKFEVKDGIPLDFKPKDNGIDGVQFWSADKKNICQYRLDGFTFSRLSPYEKWEKHFPEALKAWNIYKESLNPTNIKRLAVRFINSINLPGDSAELSDYFKNTSKPPPDLPQDMVGFLSRVVLRYEENILASVVIALQEDGPINTIPMLFDIDIFSNVNFDLSIVEIESKLKKMHDYAEVIFHSYITEKTKDLFR